MQAACPTHPPGRPSPPGLSLMTRRATKVPPVGANFPHAPSSESWDPSIRLLMVRVGSRLSLGRASGGRLVQALLHHMRVPCLRREEGEGAGGRCPDFPFRRIGPRKSMRGDQKFRPQRPEHTGDSGFISPTYPRVTQLCYSSATVAEMGLGAGWQSGVRTSGFQDISPRVTWRAWWSPAGRAPIESRRDRGNR